MGLLHDDIIEPGARDPATAARHPVAPLARWRQDWPFPVRPPELRGSWSRPLRDWLCWATAPDFIPTPPAGPGGGIELPMWTHAAVQARRLRDLATDSAVGPWTPGRLMRVHLQIAPSQPGTFRTRPALAGAAAGPAQIPALIEDLCSFANWRAPDAFVQAALLYRQIRLIRPFEQGNTRVAEIVATAVATRGGFSVEEMFPVHAILAHQAAAPAAPDVEQLLGDWQHAHARGLAFAAAVENVLEATERRLEGHLRNPGRAARLLEIASARPVLDEALVRATVGAAARSSVDYLRALEAEGWTLVGGEPPQRRRAIASGLWQRLAGIWHAIVDDGDQPTVRGAA